MLNTLTAIFISITLMGICGLGRNLQLDTGQKAEVTIDGIRFSCPKGYTVQAVSGFATTRLLRKNKDKGGAGVASLTGETFSVGKPPAMIVLPKSIPRKN